MSHRKVHYNIFQITIARSKPNCTVLKHVQYLQFMIWRKKNISIQIELLFYTSQKNHPPFRHTYHAIISQFQ